MKSPPKSPGPKRRTFVATLLLTVGLLLSGCSRPESATSERRLVVFAAASLRDAFADLAAEFERAHPGVRVEFNFAGTQTLRTQIEHGASADVFASADRHHMDELARTMRVETPVLFAENEPVVVTTKRAASSIRRFEDLPLTSRIVLGALEVPIGRYTQQILDRAEAKLGLDFRRRLEANVVSRELNVRQVLAKVTLGEADAAIVYRTDAQSAGASVSTVSIPADLNVTAGYPIALVKDSTHPKLGQVWIDFVRSPSGQEILTRAGFRTGGASASR